jgi:KaiC/GvpD/RAD55 family RecA-like ATPase
MNERLEAALELAALGWHVIPVVAGGKRPLVEWRDYQHNKPSTLDISSWWERYPDANLGIILGGGACAVDLDRGGSESLRDAGIELPADAPRVSTPSGGEHIYLRGVVPNKVRILPGVDLRGSSMGFCVAPPSAGNNGVRYAWVRGITSLDDLPSAPPALLALLNKEKPKEGLYAPDQPEWVAGLLTNGSPEGSRNADGARLAGYLYRALPSDIARACLFAWNDKNTPPLDRHEVETIAQSISRRAVADRTLPLVSQQEMRQETQRKSDARTVGAILGDLAKTVHVPTEFIQTPYESLNNLLFGGLTRQEYVLLGGRPSVGKTALGLQIAKVAAEAGRRVLLATLEMSSQQLASRLAVLWSGLSAGTVRRAGLSGPDLEAFNAAAQQMSSLPIVIESGLQAAEEIYSYVEQDKEDGYGFDLVVVDYLQCVKPMVGHRGGDRRVDVDSVSATLKKIPRQLSVPLIAISELARREGEPTIHELKESGRLEYDADIIVLLHREKFDRRVKVTVGKARDAQVGAFHLFYDGNRFSFSENDTLAPAGKPAEYEQPF